MKKFLSLFLALILVVGLLVPAVSAEPAETETKTLASWIDGASVTSNGTGDIRNGVTLSVGAVKKDSTDPKASTLSGHKISEKTTNKQLSATPWYGVDYFDAATQFAYVAFQLSTKDYENLTLKTILGGNARVPYDYALFYSLDNTTWTKVEGTIKSANKTDKASALTSTVAIPAAAADQETVYFRIAQVSAAQPNDKGNGTNAGALYIYEMALTGTEKTTGTGDETVDFAFLVTSDLHGQIYATDYSAGYKKSGSYSRGLTRVSSYIKEMRTKYGDNLYVADLGDTIQGAPLTYYYAFNKPEVDDPAIKAFRTIGYDMWVVGNHEFNYGLDILNRQLAYATSASTATEKQMTVCMANYLDAATNSDRSKNWATWKGYAPYVIKDFGGVKVAVIGFGNPNVPKWDVPANWQGIYFADIIETYKHYEAEMLAQADMIVVMAHSGINSDPVGADFMGELVASTNTISFAFSGHEHGKDKAVPTVKNSDGKDIPILQPYTKARRICQVKVSYNKTTKEATIAPENVNMEGYTLDKELAAILAPYEKTTWEDYMLTKIGEAAGDYPAANLGTAPSAFMDLINKVQIWGAYDNTGKNTPDNPNDDTPAMLSISAPLTSGGKENLIAKGDIYLGDMFSLYRFENWFYQITMTGEEVHQWLEFAATKIKVDEGTGEPVVSADDLTYYDVIYGDGFSYVIDYTAPEGSRVIKMTYNGKAVLPDQKFTVVVNNYRYNGGGDYVNYLNAHGCDFTPNDPARIIYSTQFNMLNGEDEGQARTLLTRYIEKNSPITPEITSTWKLVDGTTPKSDDIVILYTNDVHTYIDNAAGKGLRYSDVAGYRNELERDYNNVLLVDAGDHVQGTAYGGMDEGATIVKLMEAAGYDLATLGNHEFDYGMKRALEIAKSGKIPFVSCNFYEEKDGVKGNNVLDSYKIFDLGGKKVAFVGITTPESFTKSTPAYFQDENGNYIYGIAGGTDGKELYAAVQKAIDEAKAAGAEYVIGLAHLGVDESSKPWTSKEVIANVSGLNALIDGHSHTTLEEELVKDKDGKEVVLTQTGSYLKNLGQMTITTDGKISTKLISGTDAMPDMEVKAIEDNWIAAIDAELGQKIGHINATLDNYKYEPGKDQDGNDIVKSIRLVRSRETNTGDFAADALYYLFLEQGVDAAIMNGGGVRNGAITGDLTYKKMKEIHTFGNVACLQLVTGQQILDALEWGARDADEDVTKECGGFLQVSGLTYEIHTYIKSTVQKDEKGVWVGGPTGAYRVKNVKIFNKETKTWDDLDLKKTYKLAGYNYTLRNLGDGYAMFKDAVNELDYVMQDYMVLANYVQSFKNGEVTGYDKVEGEGRIKLVFKAPEQKPTPSPATGDTSSIDFFMVTGVVSVLGLGACLLLRKKKENE